MTSALRRPAGEFLPGLLQALARTATSASSLCGAETSVKASSLARSLTTSAAAAAAAPSGRSAPGHAAAGTKLGIPGVQHIITVASGKGGVGKSTTAGVHGQGGVVLRVLPPPLSSPVHPRALAVVSCARPVLRARRPLLFCSACHSVPLSPRFQRPHRPPPPRPTPTPTPHPPSDARRHQSTLRWRWRSGWACGWACWTRTCTAPAATA